MYFEVNGKQVFATTGGKPFDNKRPIVVSLHGSGSRPHVLGPAVAFFRVSKLLGTVHSICLATRNPRALRSSLLRRWPTGCNDVVRIRSTSKTCRIVAHSQGCLVALESPRATRIDCAHVSLDLQRSCHSGQRRIAECRERQTGGRYRHDAFAGALARRATCTRGLSPATPWWRAAARSCGAIHQCTVRSISRPVTTTRMARRPRPQLACPTQVILAGKDRMAPAKATGSAGRASAGTLQLAHHCATAAICCRRKHLTNAARC